MTSCSEMVEVRAATTSSRKKTVDQTMLSGMVLKIPVLDEALTDPKSEKALQKARELAKQY